MTYGHRDHFHGEGAEGPHPAYRKGEEFVVGESFDHSAG